MKKKIFIAFVFMATIFSSASLFAQENARETVIKTKGNIKDNKVSVVKINSNEDGCSIVVGNEIVSPRDAASGMPTGKRMHKPFVITKEIDVSSATNESREKPTPKDAKYGQATGRRMAGGPIGGIVVKGGKNPGGSQFNKIVVEDGEFRLPTDCPDGEYTMSLSWSWGASNSSTNKTCEKLFALTMENGICKGINQAGIK